MAENTAASPLRNAGSDVLARLPQPSPGLVPADSSTLPPNLVLSERAVAEMRTFLEAEGCAGWTVFHTADDEIYDVDRFLRKLDDAARWEAPPSMTGVRAGGTLALRSEDEDRDDDEATERPGFLMLREWGVALARWFWVDPEYNSGESLRLVAARSEEDYAKLRERITKLRHGGNRATWQIVRGHAGLDGPRIARRRNAGSELVVPQSLHEQIDRDILGFFRPEVRRLYRKLDVPYRRGVLLHGPPGNGKTSVIRMIGARLPRLPFLIVRPDRRIDAGALRIIIDRWQKQSPAVLVIEDLNWLLEQVDVSQFLNLIDGIERPSVKGLLLLATTNHPEKLDPAVNNRPGRFDVSIELPNPSAELRERFFERNLPEVDAATRRRAVEKTDTLSFAHLREILRLSGLLAIEQGRQERVPDDVLKAVEMVHTSHDRALRGFPKPPDIPFGLHAPRRR